MGLFGKKKEGKDMKANSNSKLPPLPKLPELPKTSSQNLQRPSQNQIHQLPRIPSSSFGDQFSQDSIKEAVSGRRGDEDYADDESQMMQEPLRKPMMKELDEEIEAEELGVPSPSRRGQPMPRGNRMRTSMEAEPIFVRIDDFEEAIEIFDKTSHKLGEIDRLLEKIKGVRESEEKELKSWEVNIKKLKREIERIDRDIFSKV